MRLYRSPFEPAVCLAALVFGASSVALPQSERRFTVQDDIGLSVFETDAGSARAFSPDRKYFALRSERGNLEKGLVEDTLRVYRTTDVEAYVAKASANEPAPVVVTRRFAKKSPAIVDWHWASTGTTLGFVDNTDPEHRSLFAVDVASGSEKRLSAEGEGVGVYNLRDTRDFIYTRYIESAEAAQSDLPAVVETGRDIYSILVPESRRRYDPPATNLVSVREGVAKTLQSGGIPAIRRNEAWMISPGLVVSPDGTRAITEWSVDSAPASWERLYRPMAERTVARVRAGDRSRTYVQVDLATGTVRPLVDAPTADAGGWWLVPDSTITPQWSSDGRYVLLPESFVPSPEAVPSEPCVAVFDIRTEAMECVDKVQRTSNRANGPELMERADFATGLSNRVRISYRTKDDRREIRIYERAGSGRWIGVSGPRSGSTAAQHFNHPGFQIVVIEDPNTPPRIEVRRGGREKILLNPNHDLASVRVGKVQVFHWTDAQGHALKGGLYLPPDYEQGRRYPLVIQTHGFSAERFVPSGYVPTAFAALALSSNGMVVLQVDEQCGHSVPGEADCAVAAYQSATLALEARGLIDPERVGLIGFSRTCLYVMRALTAGGIRIAAASVNDGVMGTYTQYILNAGFLNDMHARDGDIINGAPPFGRGLQNWLNRSPGFNLDKVSAPLMVTAQSPENILFMWEVYAGLHYLRKPVELVMLNIDEHVLSNPRVRLASQGGTVDWFRFWLRDEEDPDPAKAEQYQRWRALRSLASAGGGPEAR